MFTLTTIFHLGSLLVFCFMGWYILRLIAALKFNGRLWDSVSESKKQVRVWVDWSDNFLRRACQSWQITFSRSGTRPVRPVRINPKPLIDLFRIYGISEIRYYDDEKIVITVLDIPEQLEELEQQLSESLGASVNLRREGSSDGA